MAESTRNAYPCFQGSSGEQQEAGNEILKSLKWCHDKAYTDIQMALRCDEKGNRNEAIRFYSMGLKSIAKAMEINCRGNRFVGPQWDHARNMQQKMKKTALQMKTRLEFLEKEQRSNDDIVDAACGACGGGGVDDAGIIQDDVDADILNIYKEDGHSLQLPTYVQSTSDASEVLHITQGVQLFFINSNGHVSAPSSPGHLKVYKFPSDQQLRPNQPPAFLQVGEWLYPLLPGRSPSLKAADGVFMFPDMSSPDQGASVGVIFSPQVSRTQKELFQRLVQQLTVMKEEDVPSLQEATAVHEQRESERVPSAEQSVAPDATPASQREEREESIETEETKQKATGVSGKIAKGIEIGADWISWGVVKGAEVGSRLVGSGSKKLKENIKPDKQPAEIDEKYQTGMMYARKATGVAVKVSAVVLDGVCYLTKRIAEEVGPVISKQANKMLTNGEDETDGTKKAVFDGVVEVTASGIIGFGQVYRSLEAGAIQLAKSMAQATVDTVQHKYGEDAGRLTDNSLSTVGNVGVSAYNFSSLGVKALAKRTAKDTGKVVVSELNCKQAEGINSRQT